MKNFAVYILTNQPYGTLYIGLTSNLLQRIWQHKNRVVEGFTHEYSLDRLVYYELHDTAEHAIRRERRLKEWQRDWKINLIETHNPNWDDLTPRIL
jgi:putative endonuclease